MTTLYTVLGLSEKAKPEQVRAAYRKLARQYHPDLNPDPGAHEQMARINQAFEVLSDPVRRQAYDRSQGGPVVKEPRSRGSESHRPETVSSRLAYRLRSHEAPIYGVAYLGSTLISASFDNQVLWTDMGKREISRQVRFENGSISAMVVDPEGDLIAAGCGDKSLSCYWTDGKLAEGWRKNPKQWAVCVAPSPDGRWLAAGTVESIVQVYERETSRLVWSGRSHKEAVTALAWTPDSSTLVTGSADCSAQSWNVRTGKPGRVFDRIRTDVCALAVSPNNRRLAIACVDHSIRIFNLRDESLMKTFWGHSGLIQALAFRSDSRILASAGRDGTVGIWNVKEGVGHGRLEVSHQPVSSVAFSPNGRQLATGGLDKILRVWEIDDA